MQAGGVPVIARKKLVARAILVVVYGSLTAATLYLFGAVIYAYPKLCAFALAAFSFPSLMRWAHRNAE